MKNWDVFRWKTYDQFFWWAINIFKRSNTTEVKNNIWVLLGTIQVMVLQRMVQNESDSEIILGTILGLFKLAWNNKLSCQSIYASFVSNNYEAKVQVRNLTLATNTFYLLP